MTKSSTWIALCGLTLILVPDYAHADDLTKVEFSDNRVFQVNLSTNPLSLDLKKRPTDVFTKLEGPAYTTANGILSACGMWYQRVRCYRANTDTYVNTVGVMNPAEFEKSKGYATWGLGAEHPMPLLFAIIARGQYYDKYTDFQKSPKSLPAYSAKDMLATDPTAVINRYDGAMTKSTYWTYELAQNIENSEGYLAFIDRLVGAHPTMDCIGGNEECAIVGKYRDGNSEMGFAYCAIVAVDGIESAPYDCVKIAYQRQGEQWHLAAYAITFMGSAFESAVSTGATGLNGISCNGLRSDRTKVAAILAAALSNSPVGLQMKEPRVNATSTRLAGQRIGKLSEILKDTYEHVTGAFMVVDTSVGSDIFGTITLAVNRQKLENRIEYNEPSDKQIGEYGARVTKYFSERLSGGLGNEVVCYAGD